MNTMPTLQITEDGPEVGVATVRLLLQHVLEKEAQDGSGEDPELARKRAIKSDSDGG